MSVKDLISAAFNKDAVTFESTLHAVMQEKMAAAIQSRFSPAVYEEEVDLEETELGEGAYVGGERHTWPVWIGGTNSKNARAIKSELKAKGHKFTDHADAPANVKANAHHISMETPEGRSALESIKKKRNLPEYPYGTPGHLKSGHTGKAEKEDLPSHVSHAKDAPYLKEEVEQIDELSKKTLGSYIRKASDNAASHAIKYGEKRAQSDEMDRLMNRHMSYDDKDKVRKIMKTTRDDVEEPRYKAAKRLHGITKATDRLTKEEVEQIDELSKKTLGSYIKKASDDATRNSGLSSKHLQKSVNTDDRFASGSHFGDYVKHGLKSIKRKEGIAKATDRLTKEETEE